MHDPSWYSPSWAQESPNATLSTPSNKKQGDHLERLHADLITSENSLPGLEGENTLRSPPNATLARRANSFSGLPHTGRLGRYGDRTLGRRASGEETARLRSNVEVEDFCRSARPRLLDKSHQRYEIYSDQLQVVQSHLETLLKSGSSILNLLHSLSTSFKIVETQAALFQAQCEGVVADQERIEQLADGILQNLQYYTYLEPVSRKLNAPSASTLVRRNEFREILSNLDACLDYMQLHSKQRESSIYRSRYKLLLTRALTLIRNHFTNSLRDILTDVQRKISDKQINDTTMAALLYAKFRVEAPELKKLGIEIQKRAIVPHGATPDSEPEYQGLLSELYQSYSSTRSKLLLPIVAKKITEIANTPSTSRDLVAYARTTISFIRGICFDEFDLWHEWFCNDGTFYDFIDGVIEPFYDNLRPRIIHENQLLKLCELCMLIQTRYISDDDEDVDTPQGHRLDFGVLIHPALADAQNRLVFLAMSILRNDIEYFKPEAEDLDYPARNSRSRPARPALSGRKISNGAALPMPSAPTVVDDDGLDPLFVFGNRRHDWYPTLQKAIWLLSRIYRLVNSAVFDDIAHQIVHHTTLSLLAASSEISKRASPTDAQLFLLKFLLILKQQIVAFDIEFVTTPEVSFTSSLTSTFYELRERGGLFNPTNLVRLVSGGVLVPRVVRNMLDAKSELDGQLRRVINDFTASFASRITEAVSLGALSTSASNVDVNSAALGVRRAVEKNVPFLRKKLDEYLDDARTRETLVGAILDLVLEAYQTFYKTHIDPQIGKGHAGLKGKGREDAVWTPEIFEEWAAGVFAVGRIDFEDDEYGSVGGNASDSD